MEIFNDQKESGQEREQKRLKKIEDEKQSKCFFENGKCMVIHNGPLYEDRYYEPLLYSKVGYEYVLLGSYRPAKKRHFFIIDDVVFTASLYYTVTGYDWDPVGDVVDEEDPNMRYVARKELMTGMCELK